MSALSFIPERSSSSRPCRVVIADDHGLVRAGMRCLLESAATIQVVAEAEDGEEALARIAELHPDVAVVDLDMPKLDGIEVTRRLASSGQPTRVIALAASEDGHLVRDALAAGAMGFVPKSAAPADLFTAIQVVLAGEQYVHPRVVSAAIETLLNRPNDHGKPNELSARESEVLRLLALGHTTREIAHRLAVSIKTVETYKARGMEKIGTASRVELVRFAAASGWFDS